MRGLIRNVGIFGAAVAALGTQAQAEATFDLVCNSIHGGEPVHYRFDLVQQKWCWQSCSWVGPINNLTDGVIVVSVRSPDGQQNWDMTIDRYRSTYSAVHLGYGKEPADGGQCTPEPFSGFPTRRF